MHVLSESVETWLNKHHRVNLCSAFFGLLILHIKRPELAFYLYLSFSANYVCSYTLKHTDTFLIAVNLTDSYLIIDAVAVVISTLPFFDPCCLFISAELAAVASSVERGVLPPWWWLQSVTSL